MRAALERHGITLERGRYGATWTTDATRRAEDLAQGRSCWRTHGPRIAATSDTVGGDTAVGGDTHRGRRHRRPHRRRQLLGADRLPPTSFDRGGFIVRGRGKNALRRVGAAPCVATGLWSAEIPRRPRSP